MRQLGMLHTQNTSILARLWCVRPSVTNTPAPVKNGGKRVYTALSHLQRPFSGPPHIRRLSIRFFDVSMMCFYKGKNIRTPATLSLSLSPLYIYIYI